MGDHHKVKLRPITPTNRLLRPKDNTVKFGVKPETREKVIKENAKRYEKNQKDIKQRSSNLAKEIQTKIHKFANRNIESVEAWRVRTADSPYRLDQNEVELASEDVAKELFRDRKFRLNRKKYVNSMTGHPDLSFLTEEFKSKLGVEERLAVEHFATLKELETVKKERVELKRLVLDECDRTETKFVKIAQQRAQQRFQLMSAGSTSGVWDTLRTAKIGADQARELKKIDSRVYNAEGWWNESGQFVLATSDRDRIGLMSAQYAQVTGRSAPVFHGRPKEIEKF